MDYELIKYPPSEHTYHFWLQPSGPILCAKISEVFSCPGPHTGKTLHITIDKNVVNCQDCLELIHS